MLFLFIVTAKLGFFTQPICHFCIYYITTNFNFIRLEKQIQLLKRGDRKTQSEIYHLFAGKLFGICLKYSNNKQEAEDNLHDSFLKIFDSAKQFKGTGSFEGWLKRITVNTCLQKFRNQHFLSVATDEIPDIIEVEVDKSTITVDYLLAVIKELPERYSLVFSLFVLDNYSHKEIAELLKITVGTSKSNLSRARLLLKNRIEFNQESKKKIKTYV